MPVPASRLCKFVLMALIFSTFLIIGCDSAPSDEQLLKEQVTMLQNQVKGWQTHYRQLFCIKDALATVENLDMVLECGMELNVYKQKILATDIVLDNTECENKEPLREIMAYHQLAARVWEARGTGQGGDLAEDFITVVYPLWVKYQHPNPPAMTIDLEQDLKNYGQASGPETNKVLNKVKDVLNNPHAMDQLGAVANQLLWHEAHELLITYKLNIITPPFPTQ